MTMSFNNQSDEYWAEKLRRENCDQFNTLVRMHLSFVLDLNTDDNECVTEKTKLKKWSFVPFAKKPKNTNRGVMDGAPLTQEGICQVYQLIEYLSKEPNICAEGIFRRTGSLSRQQELRALLNQGQSLELDGGRYSVHDCASVLKGFLAELPEPLFTDAHYPAHCQIAELCSSLDKPSVETRLLRALQLLLLLLPSENRVLLRDVLQLLNETAARESSNKMSADSLATLFTPHLLCPRRLSPEALHAGSQQLSGIVAFMIRRGVGLFRIPPKLAVDIRSYFAEAGHQAATGSDSDGAAASTVYSFVDRERTAQAHSNNPTEAALAQLYAYIQGLPESSKKRKLVKQFNKENGNGTPLRETHRSQQHTRTGARSKSLGDSIKRHIFQKGLTKAVKRGGVGAPGTAGPQLRSSSEEVLTSPNCVPLGTRARLFCVDCETSSDSELQLRSGQYKRLERSVSSPGNLHHTADEALSTEVNLSTGPDAVEGRLSDVEPMEYDQEDSPMLVSYLTSTPAVTRARQPGTRNIFTPAEYGRKSMSPITRSTQKMSKAMQESMMTPRSRKPVLLTSGTNICALPKLQIMKHDSICSLEEQTEDSLSFDESGEAQRKSEPDVLRSTHTDPSDSLTSTFREYLCSRSILADTNPVDTSFSSRTDDYDTTDDENSVPEAHVLSDSLLFCLDGNRPAEDNDSEKENFPRKRTASVCCEGENKRCMVDKEPVLKPKQFNSDGEPIMFETSF